MKCYHGTSAEPFEKFSLAHALEGTARMKFGRGLYFTERYETAANYAYKSALKRGVTDYYVYTVEIPDMGPDNCLLQMKRVPVTASIVKRVEEKLGVTVPAEALVEGIPFRKWLGNQLTGNVGTIRQMTEKTTPEGETAVAEFLLKLGVEMIVWPVHWTNPELEKDIAVFDDSSIRIVSIEKIVYDPKKKVVIEKITL